MTLLTELELATQAAKRAGEFLRDAFEREKTVLREEGRDIKLQADRDAENLILETLSKREYPVLAEESGEHGTVSDSDRLWAVDPLDGTMNFKHGVPLCCVSIALCVDEDPVLGVVYDFNRRECFTGVAGEGAWLNGEPMRVTDASAASEAILATGFPTARRLDRQSLTEFVEMVQKFKKIRMLGSAALMLAYVAAGRVDAYAEEDIMLWDVAAGVALIRAAGGYADMRDSPRLKWGRKVVSGASPAIWARR